jgi:phage terminase small subunit
MSKLSGKEQAFVLAFYGKAAGNATKAAEIAGYAKGSAHVTASRLLRKAKIAEELERLKKRREDTVVATAVERDQVLTRILRSPTYKPITRIRAIQELNRVEGRHVNRHEIKGTFTLEQVLGASRTVEP